MMSAFNKHYCIDLTILGYIYTWAENKLQIYVSSIDVLGIIDL